MTFNWWTFLFEAFNFVALAYVLHRLLYRPLREAIDRRRQANARAQEAAATARREAEALREELRGQLAATESQRQGLIHQARARGEAERQKLLADAQEAAWRRGTEVRQALEREREEALTAVRQEVIDQAVDLTRRLLAGAAERTLHQQLTLRLAQELTQAADAEREELRAAWPAGAGAVLESAADLDAATLGQLTRAVADLAGRPVELAVQPRPELLGGVRLRLGGHVWDGSLAGQLTVPGPAPGKDGPP